MKDFYKKNPPKIGWLLWIVLIISNLFTTPIHAQMFGGQMIPNRNTSSNIIIPSTITLAQNQRHFIASVNDNDYLPYSPPTAAASTVALGADGTTETLVDVQGTLTTTGITVRIPVTVTGAGGTLPTFSQTINVPANLTEDGIARNVTLSWASQSLTTSNTFINATIQSVGGTLNVKKLDINTGIGNDYLGILLSQFTYPYNNAGATTTYQVRALPGIPDRMFGLADNGGAGTENRHRFLYLPMQAEDGRVWLNNNLGANYSNLNHSSFNPAAQATSATDFNSYGSLFQWGRRPDGHELINFNSNGTSATAVNGTTTTTANIPTNTLFIVNGQNNDWRQNSDATLLQSVVSTNNPCPIGFRVPTRDEWNTQLNTAGITNLTSAFNSTLRISANGQRNYDQVTQFSNIGSSASLWTSSPGGSSWPNRSFAARIFSASITLTDGNPRSQGFAVRCILDETPPASLTLDCSNTTHVGNLANGVAASGVSTSIPYTGGNGGVQYGTSAASTGVTGLTATLAASTIANGSGNLVFNITGTPSSEGTASFTFTVAGQTCTFTRTVASIIIPSTITLAQNQRYFIASVNDDDYLPYTPPTATASINPLGADGTTETLVNVQGTLTTTGVTVRIPVTVTGAGGTLPAFSQTINVPASLTEDGNSRDVTLSWASQALNTSNTFITATIRSVDGILNVKKLDINTGIGSDYLGILLSQFTYPYNNAGQTTNYQVRALPGIPDRMFGLADNGGAGTENRHMFLYLPMQAEDGRVWLNNNLGANYTNLSHSEFNPASQAQTVNDFNAFGSLFQWGRRPDGHELIIWTSTSTFSFKSPTTTSRSDNPSHSSFILPSSGNDWRNNNSNTLWNGIFAVNNPCPVGFRVPTIAEFTNLVSSAALNTVDGVANSSLKLSNARERTIADSFGNSNTGLYWISNPTQTDGTSNRLRIVPDSQIAELSSTGTQKIRGFSIRCIQDQTPPASLTLDCSNPTHAGTLSSGTAASGVSTTLSYTGGNAGVQFGASAASTGVTGLTATLAASTIANGSGDLVFTITGTPSSEGTASFTFTVAGQTCTFTRNVTAFVPNFTAGAGSLSGRTCFDIAESNDDVNSCGPLSSRTTLRADFNLASINTQTYTFTPTAAVSNVRFYYVNTNGQVIQSLTGGNAGNNITTAVTATAVYNTALSSPNPNAPSSGLALGTTSANGRTADIYVVYNDNGTNTGTDRQLKLTSNVRDCACCGAYVSATEWKEFLCHNLGADITADPHDITASGWRLQGAYIQWGKRGPNTTGDSRVDWQNAPSNGSLGFAAAPTASNTNATSITSWSSSTATNNSWRTAAGAKTANDPCPAGYRVPTQQEYLGVIDHNSLSTTGTIWTNSATNYGIGIHYGPNGSSKTLTFPAAGYRFYTNGELDSRGALGAYWTSTTLNTSSSEAFYFTSSSRYVMSNTFRTNAKSIRCIKE
jgi:uncharacterized protein (TIGR02145 family)